MRFLLWCLLLALALVGIFAVAERLPALLGGFGAVQKSKPPRGCVGMPEGETSTMHMRRCPACRARVERGRAALRGAAH